MKKVFIAAFALISMSACAQKNDIPAAAKTAFAKAYPTVSKPTWEKEDGNFEASFEKDGQQLSVIYNAKGEMLESEVEIKVTDLPATVADYMKLHYKGITIKSAAKITKSNGTVNYEAGIKGKDVLFDAAGKFLKEAKD